MDLKTADVVRQLSETQMQAYAVVIRFGMMELLFSELNSLTMTLSSAPPSYPDPQWSRFKRPPTASYFDILL